MIRAGYGIWQEPWMLSVLSLPITTGVSRTVVTAAFVLTLALLAWRRGVPRWSAWAAAWTAGGAALGALAILIVDVLAGQVPGGLPTSARVWLVAAFAGLGLVGANLTRLRRGLHPGRSSATRRRVWWRGVAATLAVLPILVAGALGVNAAYGVLTSVGALLGKPTVPVLDEDELARPVAPDEQPEGPLARTWDPPPGMPTVGRRSAVVIPGTVSGFTARPAGLYLPPAALVEDPPVLPVVVMMMGQPGSPDVNYVADYLDVKAAAHGGLAPIVVVADQSGESMADTLCMDTTYFGNVETYVNTDVVAWIREHLRVSAKREGWMVSGYSNGGLCSARFFARHPDVWGNVLSISPEEFPGSDYPDRTLADYFGGDQVAYDAERLPRIYEGADLRGTWAVYSVALDDDAHLAGVRRIVEAARRDGAHTIALEFPSGGHGSEAMYQALDKGYDLLYPRLGLALP